MIGSRETASNDPSGDISLEADLRALGDAASVRADDAVRRIAARGRSAVPGLVVELSVDRLGGVGRARILRLLAECRAPKVLPLILEALDDQRHIVRAAAIDAVAAFNDPRASVELVRLLSDRDVDVVKQAAFRLGERRDKGAVETLGRLLDRPEQGVRYSAARALAAMTDPRACQFLVAHLIRETDNEVRAIIEKACAH